MVLQKRSWHCQQEWEWSGAKASGMGFSDAGLGEALQALQLTGSVCSNFRELEMSSHPILDFRSCLFLMPLRSNRMNMKISFFPLFY